METHLKRESTPQVATASRDLLLLLKEPGVVRVRVSAAARVAAIFAGGVGLLGAGVVGGVLWSYRAHDADLLFFPLFSAYLAFAFWLYLPQGYLFTESGFQVLRPRGVIGFSRRRVLALCGAPALVGALAKATGAAWLLDLPVTQTRPAGARLLVWIDPAVGMEGESLEGEALRGFPLPLPLGGAILIWGGQTGRFWTRTGGVEQRYSRSFRPRLGFWMA